MLGRQALVSLKLLTASPSERKHTNDLLVLAPTDQELDLAHSFVIETDGSTPRIEDLEIILNRLNAHS